MKKLWALAAGVLVLTACAPNPSMWQTPTPSSTTPGVASPSQTPSNEPSPATIKCMTRVESMTLAEQVGQLYMVAVPTSGLTENTAQIIKQHQVGSVVLLGNSFNGMRATGMLTDKIRGLGTASLPILVAVDQEGGTVQRLKGQGFSPIPSALDQARMSDAELTEAAKQWGQELKQAGIRYNLAPVADVVPQDKQNTNEPVGKLRRGYGSDPDVVADKVTAFIEGMRRAGVATSVKHFPNLGEVTANTDFGKATDNVTGPNSPSWAGFRAAIEHDVSSVMVSSAIYPKLDPGELGMYSSKIVTGILRDEIGFDKVVISDDVGVAAALDDIDIAERGTRFIAAGGDLVINANAAVLPQMIANTVALAEKDPEFAAKVKRSAARVLELKASVDLVDCGD